MSNTVLYTWLFTKIYRKEKKKLPTLNKLPFQKRKQTGFETIIRWYANSH